MIFIDHILRIHYQLYFFNVYIFGKYSVVRSILDRLRIFPDIEAAFIDTSQY